MAVLSVQTAFTTPPGHRSLVVPEQSLRRNSGRYAVLPDRAVKQIQNNELISTRIIGGTEPFAGFCFWDAAALPEPPVLLTRT